MIPVRAAAGMCLTDGSPEGSENSGTIILDATCAPQNIRYPQDVNLLNESRENLEALIDRICYDHNYYKPRMYRNNARRDYLDLARCRKRTSKKIRKALKKQLQYIRRDRAYIEAFLDDGVELTPKQEARLKVIDQVYEQQQYMYENNVHSVTDRIVSISQPYIRPIVRGKAAAPVEFGAIERYKERTGHYPQRTLADKIYRNRENLAFCKQHGIRLSGPSLGRPKKNAIVDKKTEYADNAERVEVERAFSLAKRCYGLGRIMTKLDITTRSSIALSVMAMNVDRLASHSLFQFLISLFSRYRQHGFMLTYMQNNRCGILAGY